MKNNISKFMMIAVAALALFATDSAHAQKSGGSTGPTPVEEQNIPARTAVDVGYLCGQNTSTCNTTFAVPAGMRLVLESVDGGLGAASATPLRLFFFTSLDGVQAPGTLISPTTHTPYYAAYMSDFGRLIKIYTDSVTSISVLGTSTTTSWLHFHGYLVKK
jgi:hypothetical protein